MRLFISYARFDKYRVEELVKILSYGGHEPWFDVKLLPGQDWKAILLKNVLSCDAFVYCLTPDSVASEWCQWEFGEAINAARPIIPVLLHKNTQVPDTISQYQIADFTDGPTPNVVASLIAGLSLISIIIPPVEAPKVSVPDASTPPAQVLHDAKSYTISQSYMKKVALPLVHKPRERSQGIAIDQKKPGRILGIDFGTTNSLCAVSQDGQPIIIPNKLGMSSTPSAVAVGLDGSILVGESALKFALQYPERSVLEVKRLFGSDLALEVDGKQYDPATIASFVLKTLKEDAEAFLGEPVSKAVLTLPAYFNAHQLDTLRRASELADIQPLNFIPEPTAATMAFGLQRPRNAIVAVFDIGGGTFDISVMEIGDGVFQVHSVNGDAELGGLDYDMLLVKYCLAVFKQQTKIDLTGSLSVQMRIREAAERAKIILSSAQETNVYVPYIYADTNQAYNLDVPLTRAKFNQLTYHLVERSIECCKAALRYAGLTTKDVKQLVLVGMSTRTPSIYETVSNFFGVRPAYGIDPDRIVALGSAIQAGIYEGQIKDVLLLSATQFTLGVETLGGVATPIIERNTTFPTKKSRVFTTVEDNQSGVIIHLIQGETTVADDSISLGSIFLDGIPSAPRGVPQIEVMFDIEANGVLNVTVTDKAKGHSQKKQIIPPIDNDHSRPVDPIDNDHSRPVDPYVHDYVDPYTALVPGQPTLPTLGLNLNLYPFGHSMSTAITIP